MTRKVINTRRQAQACDVCHRTLLRGEQPEIFVDGSVVRAVCKLCIAWANQAGWIREGTGGLPQGQLERQRRSSLFTRWLNRKAEPTQDGQDGEPTGGSFVDQVNGLQLPAAAESELFALRRQEVPPPVELPAPAAVSSELELPPDELAVLQATIAAFNRSEHVREVVGIVRSLGAPEITVRCAGLARAFASITAVWSICWYRFGVDLGREVGAVWLLDRGYEREQLPAEDLDGVPVFVGANGTLQLQPSETFA